MDFVTIESHFNVPNNSILARTRNRCSYDLLNVINEIASILYPAEEFELYLLPSEYGSYKDIVKIVKKKSGMIASTAAICATLGTVSLSYLTYKDTHAEYQHNIKMQVIDDSAKCLNLKQQIAEVQNEYQIDNILQEKINEICGNLKLTKLKNDRFHALKDDVLVASEESVLKDAESNVIFHKRIDRNDFEDYIDYVDEEDYTKQQVGGVIELVALVVKQKKEGKGIPWKGIYYGDPVKEKGLTILNNEEEVKFYMQDDEFKKKIENHEIVFSSGDTMRVIFDIKGLLTVDGLQNRSIYVKRVEKFNADIIEHKKKLEKNKFVADDITQIQLFNNNTND